MEKRELTCIGCPLGCSITVTLENGEIRDVTGYTCKRGHDYARKEVTNPTRIVTSTVRLTGSRKRRKRREERKDWLAYEYEYIGQSCQNYERIPKDL